MDPFFVEALDTREHPIKTAKMKIKAEYITALTYLIEKTINEQNLRPTEMKYVSERLRIYQAQLFAGISTENVTVKYAMNCLAAFCKPWRSKYRFMLVCDAALILLEDSLVLHAAALLKEHLSARRRTDIENIISLLYDNKEIEEKYLAVSSLIRQFRVNRDFSSQEEKRIVVTANMSAGKSTLINAFVGKPIARTSQEVCTGNICCIFNKPFEDGTVQLKTQDLNMNASPEDLRCYNWDGHIFIAAHFELLASHVPRLCIIDTPGVDAALYKEHRESTREALLKDEYSMIVYVISPTRLGTAAETKHLKWTAQNLRKDKIIFVLNKLDDYHAFSDSIEESVSGLKADLLNLGFEDPVICPISAYFSYLLKLKMTGQALSEDEADEYALYSKKFKRASYDLSHYYEGVQCLPTDSEEIALSKRVGLYGLEKILFGGIL